MTLYRSAGFLRSFSKDRLSASALILVVLVVIVSLFAPYICPHDPYEAVARRNAAPGTDGLLLGADAHGRDLLTRLIWGGRVSLLVGIAPVFFSTIFSLGLGLFAGYFGGWIDQMIMRILDVIFAFPLVLLAVSIAGVLTPGLLTEIVAITVVMIPRISRLARTSTQSIKVRPYIEAAQAGGAPERIILFRYVLPNMISPVLVYSMTYVGHMIVIGSGLSFLGLGVLPPVADWGSMVSEGGIALATAPHATIFPGLAIIIVSLAFNLIADRLRDVLDPKHLNR